MKRKKAARQISMRKERILDQAPLFQDRLHPAHGGGVSEEPGFSFERLTGQSISLVQRSATNGAPNSPSLSIQMYQFPSAFAAGPGRTYIENCVSSGVVSAQIYESFLKITW